MFRMTFDQSDHQVWIRKIFTLAALCTGEPAADHEEGGNTDAEPQNVQQIQKE